MMWGVYIYVYIYIRSYTDIWTLTHIYYIYILYTGTGICIFKHKLRLDSHKSNNTVWHRSGIRDCRRFNNFADMQAPKWSKTTTNQQESNLWLFNIAMENGPFIDDFPINTSIYKGFSMAMLNNQMVTNLEESGLPEKPLGRVYVEGRICPLCPCYLHIYIYIRHYISIVCGYIYIRTIISPVKRQTYVYHNYTYTYLYNRPIMVFHRIP
jgi:hypothetical protein